MHLYDIVRSLVTNAMVVALLFTLAQPKFKKHTLWITLVGIVAADLAMNMFFYLRDDYSTLAVMDIVFFILVGAATKPLFREKLMQWLFNCFTVMNTYAIAVVVSYFLCDCLPYPAYANTVLRALLFAAAILLFRKRLRPLYRQAAEHWSIYLFVSAALFLNFAYYFVSGDDVEQTLTDGFVPLLLLILVTVLMYLAMFFSMRKTIRQAALREENLRIQSDRELTRQRLALMDENVDIVVFGHTHVPALKEIADGTYYVNSGTWVDHNTDLPGVTCTFTVITTGEQDTATLYTYVGTGGLWNIDAIVNP